MNQPAQPPRSGETDLIGPAALVPPQATGQAPASLAPNCTIDADCDDGNPCTADSCVSGNCHLDPLPDGTPCDDGDRCTVDNACLAGQCAGRTIRVRFGDVNSDGFLDIVDILCIFDGYDDETLCPTGDIAPCDGDRMIELADLLAALRAYTGLPPECPDPCP